MKQNSDPVVVWKWSVGVTYFVAAMNMALGWFASSSGSGRVGAFEFNAGLLFGAAILYLILAICANNRLTPALWIAVVLFSLDAVAMVLMTAGAGHFSLWGLWLRIMLIATMYRGIPALTQMNQSTGNSTAPTAPAPVGTITFTPTSQSAPQQAGYSQTTQSAPQQAVTLAQVAQQSPQQAMTFAQMPQIAPQQSHAMPQRVQDVPLHVPEMPWLGGFDLPR